MVPGARGRGTSGLIHDSACSHCISVFERLLKPGAGCVVGMWESQEHPGKKAAPNFRNTKGLFQKHSTRCCLHTLWETQGTVPYSLLLGLKEAWHFPQKKSKGKLRAPQLRHLVARYVSTAAKQASPTPRLPQDADCAPRLQEAPSTCLAPGVCVKPEEDAQSHQEPLA